MAVSSNMIPCLRINTWRDDNNLSVEEKFKFSLKIKNNADKITTNFRQ